MPRKSKTTRPTLYGKMKTTHLLKNILAALMENPSRDDDPSHLNIISQLMVDKIKTINEESIFANELQANLAALIKNTIEHTVDIQKVDLSPSTAMLDSESKRIRNVLNAREDYGEIEGKEMIQTNEDLGLKLPPDELKLLENILGEPIKQTQQQQYFELTLRHWKNAQKRKFCTKIAKHIYFHGGKIKRLVEN